MQPSPNPDWFTSVMQGVAGNAVWWIVLGGLGIMLTVLKRYRSNWLVPAFYGLIGMTLFAAVLYSGTLYSRWPRATPVVLVASIVTAAVFHFTAVLLERRHKPASPQPVGQSDIEKALIKSQARVAEIEQALRVAQDKLSEPDNAHMECEKKIARLLDSESTHAKRADAHEGAFKAFKEKYAVPLAMADYQATKIGEFVEVVRVCTHDPKLDEPMPTIKWAILVKNRSVHRVSLEGDVGPLFFEGHKLSEHKDILENKIMGLYPDREGSIVFEQRLSAPEVNLLRNSLNGKFEFDKVKFYVTGGGAPHLGPHRVMIFSRFRATLGKCSDEKSQAVEEAAAHLDGLRAELNETSRKLDRENIAERKALIASWRACVSKAYRDYQDSGWSFTGLLATQDEFLSLTPNLSSEVKEVIELSPHPEYDDVRRLVNILAEDIARIEREWDFNCKRHSGRDRHQ